MASLGAEIFSRGFRFNPTPLEAATYYLPRLVACAPLHEAVRPVVHYAEVYGDCEPAELARQFCPLPRTGHRFFFSSCKKGVRIAGPGSWYLQSTTAIKDRAEAKVGEIKKFRYKKRGVFTDWLMDEVSTCFLEEAFIGDRQFVFCKMYVSPRAAPHSAAHQESAAFFAPPAPAPVIAMTQAPPPPKRPAPQSAKPPCPKRMRGTVGPIPPAVQPAGCTTSLPLPRSCVPNHGVPASAQPPTRLAAAPPRSLVRPKQQMPSASPSVPRVCHMPVQAACMPQRGVAPSSTPSVTRSPPPAPAPRLALPTPPLERACRHMPVQAPAPPSVQRKQRMRDPFEAAQLRDETEEETPEELLQDDDLAKDIEDVLAKDTEDQAPTAEAEEEAAASSADGSMMTDDEIQQLARLLDDEIEMVPNEEIPDAIA